ncbi:META domain-containing protein [Bowmanella sp. Y26]|uniref:META domain-containing protein n=1 Tax=Bowmanella yangjiangensis TaxID=2811230 RepID=UPI001BDC8A7D|nr:META domain-containing protein [Bowmanella yangjiangensis]MBT1065215.1 META domain-containing protein [Bowmanella yangjiangensis]
MLSTRVGIIFVCLALSACGLGVQQSVDSAPKKNHLAGQWQLTELAGQPVQTEKAPYLDFSEEGKVSGFAGCNRFFGQVEVEGLSIHFGKLGATMMACPNMQLESQFMQVLEKADNYTMGSNDSLSLNKARMAPLARFERVKAD